MLYGALLNDFVTMCKEILGSRLTGVYLHGSMAMGCFHEEKSDIDLIVVTEDSMTFEQKSSLMERIVILNGKAPEKGLEISFVKREYCRPFVYPTPFELHFAPMHQEWFQNNPKDYVDKMNGVDPDLAAHFTIINQYGVTLYGAEIQDVFGAVLRRDYIDSIWYDIENAQQDILDNPMYIVLNLCRVLAYLKENLILSKEKGGEWGMAHLDVKYSPLISRALECYCSDQMMQAAGKTAQEFACEMVERIKSEIR